MKARVKKLRNTLGAVETNKQTDDTHMDIVKYRLKELRSRYSENYSFFLMYFDHSRTV